MGVMESKDFNATFSTAPICLDAELPVKFFPMRKHALDCTIFGRYPFCINKSKTAQALLGYEASCQELPNIQ